jgi:hypothetical protein
MLGTVPGGRDYERDRALIIGAVVGWLASLLMKTNAQMGIIAVRDAIEITSESVIAIQARVRSLPESPSLASCASFASGH